jgi:transposase
MAARQDWRMTAAGIDPARLVFIDESAALTNMVRTYARSPRGTRAHGTAPCGHWQRLSIIGALGVEGMAGALTIEGATDGTVFHAFLERVLLPELKRTKPAAVIVMDNLRAHKTQAVRDLLERAGFAYRYLPPYSPDFNPIELVWAPVKAQLRTAAARSVATLHDAIGSALAAVTADDATACFRHAGYGS